MGNGLWRRLHVHITADSKTLQNILHPREALGQSEQLAAPCLIGIMQSNSGYAAFQILLLKLLAGRGGGSGNVQYIGQSSLERKIIQREG